MRHFILILASFFIISCSESDNTQQEEFINQEVASLSAQGAKVWQLVGMSGMMPNSYTSGNNMSFQESIVLKDDATFIKFREAKEEKKQAAGTYQWQDNRLTLSYNEDSELIGNCTGTLNETYHLDDNQLQGDWWACDGPGLFYELNNI